MQCKKACPLYPQERTYAAQQTALLFDHLVRACDERGRHREAECLGCFEIDHQLVLSGRLHRQVGWLFALEDAIDIACRAPELVGNIRPIGD
jgi:hypothetical protein